MYLCVAALTSKWKELGVDIFESELIDGSTGAFLLECTVHPSYFILGELGGSSEVIQVIRAIPHYWTSQTILILLICIWSTKCYFVNLRKTGK
jgi:hypothetical protein